jgi:hypothetical protein
MRSSVDNTEKPHFSPTAARLIRQPPVLLHVMPLGYLSATILSALRFLLIHKIAAAVTSQSNVNFTHYIS